MKKIRKSRFPYTWTSNSPLHDTNTSDAERATFHDKMYFTPLLLFSIDTVVRESRPLPSMNYIYGLYVTLTLR